VGFDPTTSGSLQ